MSFSHDDPFYYQRQSMVDRQLAGRDIVDAHVLEVMRAIPRHEFVPPKYRAESYSDNPLPIGFGQTISQPYIVALMTQLAQINNRSRVLEIGTGCGYQTAVLAELAGEVFTVEIIEALSDAATHTLKRLGYNNVEFRHGDGNLGWEEHSPYDAIIVAAAPKHVPEPLVEQLAIGGRLVIPIGDNDQDLLQITKEQHGTTTRSVVPVRFVPMTRHDSEE